MTLRKWFPALLILGAAVMTAQAVRAQQDESGGDPILQLLGQGAGVRGTVLAAAATGSHSGHFTVRTDEGATYQVFYSPNTRMMKEQQQSIEAGEIHVGDMLIAAGQVDKKANRVGAVLLYDIDAEKVRDARAGFGKTWTAGKVKAIHDLTITIERLGDRQTQRIAVDENTSFRKRQEDITLADVKVGDFINVQGEFHNGIFQAAVLRVMGPQSAAPGNEQAPPGISESGAGEASGARLW